MEYARVVDIHEWYRNWGIDWARVDDNFDLVGIRAGVGTYQDALLGYFIDQCIKIGKPYFTYFIPTPASFGYSVEYQAGLYLGWPGVRDALQCMDIEPPYFAYPDRMISGSEALRFVKLLEKPFWYSNKNYLDRIAWPAGLADYDSWLASYPLKWDESYYRYFDEYLVDFPNNELPWYFANSIYAKKCKLKQFTKKGDALYYLSIAPNGIKEADLSLSTGDRDAFLAWASGGVVIPPEPPGDEIMTQMKCIANTQNVRSGHGTNYSIVGQIVKNTMVDVINVWSDPVTLGNVWAKISAPIAGWAAIRYSGTTYMTGGGE